MRSNWSRSLFVALVLLFLPWTASAATRTWTGTANNNWSTPANWSPAVAPLPGDSLVFPAGLSGTLTNDQLSTVRDIRFEGGGYVLTGSDLTITHGIAQTATAGTNEVVIALQLGANQTFSCASGSTLRFTKAIAYGGFTLTADVAGQGTIRVSATNTGAGTVTKSGDGFLLLDVAQNAPATWNVTAGRLQIAAAFEAPVAVTAPGVVEVGVDVRFTGLTMTGGSIVPSAGLLKQLMLFNPVTITSSSSGPAVIGDGLELDLDNGVTFFVADGPQTDDFRIRAFATDNGGTITSLVKNGPGRMTLEDGSNGNSSFTGDVYVNDGQLSVRDKDGLGSNARGTIVAAGGTLEIDASNVADEISMQGGVLATKLGGTVTGPVKLLNDTTVAVDDGRTLFLDGVVSGNGHLLPALATFQSTLALAKANTFAGPVTLAKGTLSVAGSQPGIDINLNGSLAGLSATGDVGVVTVTDGYVSMGTETTMTAKGLSFSGGSFTTSTYSNTFTRCTVNGAVNLGGANFNVNVYSGWAPTPGQPYVIIANDGTDPIVPFGGIPEGGDVFTAGYRFKVSYTGGDGNDLTITRVPPAFILDQTSYSVKESEGPVTVSVWRIGELAGTASVTLETWVTSAQNQAAAGGDYQSQSVTLTWPDGNNDVKTVPIPVTADTQVEPDEQFGVRLVNPNGAVLGGTSSAPVTIRDDDSTIGLSASTYSAGEGDGTLDVVLSRTGQGSALPAVSVQFDTIAGTATPSNDYAPIQGASIGWAENETGNKTNPVTLLEDTAYEGAETFTVRISTSSPVNLSTSEAAVTISDNDAPNRGTLAFDPDAYTVSEDAGTITISVSRKNGSDGAVSVQYATSDGTATSGSDYTAKSGLLSWGEGDSATKTFQVALTNDSTNEAGETFTITLSNPTGGAAIGGPATIGINDDDTPNPGTLQLSSSAYSAKENAGKITITATRTGGSQGEVMVQWSPAPGTATSPDDYPTQTTFLTWPDGDTSPKSVDVVITDDAIKEADETFTVALSNATNGAAIGSPSQATLTILNDDLDGGEINLQGNVTQLENGGAMTFTVTRTGASEGPASVHVATADNSATAGSDYQSTSTTLNWADGDASPRSFTVPIVDDDVIESAESFNVILDQVTGAVLGATSSAAGLIDNDDSEGFLELSASKYTVTENGGTVTITVNRLGGKSGPATVTYATSDNSAVAGSDYTAKTGTLTWAAGDGAPKTVAISILDDSAVEQEETFTVTLSNATGAGMGNASWASVAITNDDAPNPGKLQLAASTYTVAEGGSFVVNVERVGGSSGQVAFSIRTVPGTAGSSDVPAVDYLRVFPDGETTPMGTTFNVWDDSLHEGPETFTIEIYDPTGGATLGTPATATVTVTDDDPDVAGYLRFSATSYTFNENAGNATISVARIDGGKGSVSVNYRAQARSATSPEDFGATTGTLTWADGEKGGKTFNIPIVNDTETESYEILDLFLSNPTNGADLTYPSNAEVYIADDDTAPTGDIRFAANAYSVNESAGNIVVSVTRIGGSSGPASIQYTMNDAGATSNADYTPLNGTLNWADGDAAPKTITIPILDNNQAEGEEAFDVTLFNPAGASLNPEFLTKVTIVDDDSPGEVALATASAIVVEDGGSLTVTVKRSNGSRGPASVKYEASEGSAMVAADYAATTGTLNWADGDAADKTFSIPIVDDGDPEAVENFLVALSQPSGAQLGAPNEMKVTVNDDDGANPGSLQLTAATASAGESANSVQIKVSRTGGSDGAVFVSFASANGSATAGADYVAASGTLLWQNGDAADKTISIALLDDSIIDAAETFTVQLSNAGGGATLGNPQAATITIDDDDLAGTLQFSSATSSVSEAAGSLTISVTRTGGSAGAASVQVATANGSASAGADYSAVSQTLNWAAGDSATKTISITILNDGNAEGAETFSASLSNGTGAAIGNPSAATITIVDDEVPPAGTLQLSSATYSGAENGGSILITVNRTGGSNGPASVQYATSSGSATSGADFTAASGTLSWANGVDGAQTFAIPVIDDGTFEGSESLTVQLSNAAGATLGNLASATVTIADDDAPPAGTLQLTASSFQVLENAGSLVVTVSRTGGSGGPASVQYSTAPGTATAAADYVAASGTLQWADGDAASKTFSIAPVNDASAESPETFTVSIGNATGAALGTPSTATVTIESEDIAPAGTLQFASASASVAENGGSVTVTVTRTGGSNGAADVQIATADGIAKAGQDYVAKSAALHWDDGDSAPKTFLIDITDDSVIEGGPETFTVSLANATGASFGNPTSMAVSILDNDVASSGTLQLASASFAAGEASGTVALTVTRTGGADGVAGVQYTTANGTAGGADYMSSTGTLQWADGDGGAKTILIALNDDSVDETDETFTVTLTGATGAALGSPAAATVTITDDDAPAMQPGFVQFTQGSARVNENAGVIVLAVARTGGTDGAASVLFSTSGSTAFANSDYTAGSGSLHWADGDDSPKTFQIAVLNDAVSEPAESFTVQLTGATGATLGTPSLLEVTIDDDDAPSAPPSLSVAAASAREDEGAVTFLVSLSRPATAQVRARYATSPGTAADGDDYSSANGMLFFEPGQTSQTITVPLIDDELAEETETFTVMLFDVVNASVTNASADATITDDDGATPLRFAIAGSVRGANGSNYKTSLQIFNPAATPIEGRIVFGAGGAGGGGSVSALPYRLAPGELRSYADLLASIDPSLTGLGALDIVPAAGAAPLSVMRVYNDGEEKGTWGMTEDAANGLELVAGQRGILIAPADAQQHRFNVGVRTFDAPAVLRITTRNAAGQVLQTVDRTFGATSVMQSSAAAFLGAALENDAVLEVDVLSGAAVVYGTTTDNITQDTAIAFAAPVVTADAATRVSRTIPVVASTAGSHGSFFRTSVQLHNPYAFAQSVVLRYGTQQLPLTLEPRQTRSLADVVTALGSAGIGSVDVEATGGAPVAAIRVFNDGGALGTSGLAEPLAGDSQVLRTGDRAALLPPSDLEKFRFNVGVRAFGEGAVLRVTCGASPAVERAYGANQFGQVGASDFCGSALTAAPLRVEVIAGSAIVYGATTDNVTQDPNMQFAQKY